ncbi:hypothetical protein JJB99_34510 [Bradyrhizobium diazoefficiens]|uniref:hypothetical protein n=1 Tax=Bradyrhizobium diazoefficiens TaxID=1355477 RepID=UPI00190BB1A3|nr:hypothetical protein [Bradyrhizobium diazoefficiens]QQO14351.1 hypothetical protein JJB99_34510 [Bradyrhizobium diazoefficiens]
MKTLPISIFAIMVVLLSAGLMLLIGQQRHLFDRPSFTKSVEVTNPGQDRAIYYRLKVNLAYNGEPLDFDIVVGCRVRITTYKDNERTVEVGIAPMAYGLKMKDGHGVVVRPPEACRGETTENGKVPAALLPLVVTYENAEEPWFGLAYASEDAYASPMSELKFFGATISKATREEWVEWRRTQAPKNFVTYELLGINEKNRWDKPRWKAGYRAMGSICVGLSRVKLPEPVSEAIRAYWPASKPDYWYPNGAAWDTFYSAADYHGGKVLFEGSPLRERFPVEAEFFPGLPRHKPGALIFFKERVAGDVYPASSDLSMNRLDAAGLLPAEIRAKARKSYIDVNVGYKLKGFAFCDVVWNIDGLPSEINDPGNLNANRIDGQQINEELNRVTGDFGHAFERDEYVFFRVRLSVANIFGGL